MKPRNKYQEKIVATMPTLKLLTFTQRQWAYRHALPKYAYRRANGKTVCMECGCTFETREKLKQCTCSYCHKRLEVKETKMRTLHREGYFCIATTKKGMQVLRYFKASSDSKIGKPTITHYYEVMQRWINEKGDTATTSLPRALFSWYTDSWSLSGKLELREGCSAMDYIDGCPTYPSISTIPAIRRNGFKGCLHGIAPASLFESLLTRPRIETLFKAGQYAIARHFAYAHGCKLDKYWGSIKIAIRNRYIIKDATIWCDYLDTLTAMGKDIHNAKFVCPADLMAEHDRWKETKERKDEAQRIKEDMERAREDEAEFQRLKSKFFGIQFTDGLINVHVLDSIEEYQQEGEHMHHCVFSNRYYLEEDSLVLSATIDGKRVETVELSLITMKVLQSFGVCNKLTQHHDRIIDLVQRNAYLISQRMCA